MINYLSTTESTPMLNTSFPALAFLTLLLSFGQLHGQERPVRFVIASFEVDGSNEDLARRLRSDFESQLFDVTDQCREFLEFIPDAREEALEYIENVRTRYRIEYSVETDQLQTPKRGNYLMLVNLQADNFGVLIRIGVFRKAEGQLTFLARGDAASEVPLSKLYERNQRKALLKEALEDAFKPDRVFAWILEESGKKSECFSPASDSLRPDSIPPKPPLKVEAFENGFTFSMTDCYFIDTKLRIAFTIVCTQKHLLYLPGGTHCYDNHGIEHSNPKISIGNLVGTRNMKWMFQPKIPIDGYVEFADVAPDTKKVVDLQLNVTTAGSYNVHEMLEFRNILVRQE